MTGHDGSIGSRKEDHIKAYLDPVNQASDSF